MKAIMGLIVLSTLLAGCATQMADRGAEGDALVANTPSAECAAAARRVTSPAQTTADAPFSSSGWTEARRWEVATSSSQAQIAQDIAWMVYQECMQPPLARK
jgi:hypothetical protein